MSTLRVAPQVGRSPKKFIRLVNNMLIDPTRIAYLKQMNKPKNGLRALDPRGWEVGGLNGLVDAQFLFVSDEVAQQLFAELAMVEVFDDQYKVPIWMNMTQIAGVVRNSSVIRFYSYENGKRTLVLTSMLASTEPLGF